MGSGDSIEEKLYHYKGEVLRVIDGDTIIVNMTILPEVKFKTHIRLLHINAPEMHGASAEAGVLSKQWLENRVLGKEVIIRTSRTDSFGRWLAEVYLDNTYINGEMLSLGYAEPYH